MRFPQSGAASKVGGREVARPEPHSLSCFGYGISSHSLGLWRGHRVSRAERGYRVTLAASMAQSVDKFEPMSFRRSGLEEVAEEYWVFDLLTLSPSPPDCLEYE